MVNDFKECLQIAHRFMLSQIGATFPAGKAGSGDKTMAYVLDLSIAINYNLQPKLEQISKKSSKSNIDNKAMQDISSDTNANSSRI